MIQTKYKLNEGQQVALDWLVDFCLGQTDYRKVLLSGYAGTGKTFLVNRVVEAVRNVRPGMNFGMTAPTHKAVKVLKRQSDLRDSLDFGTIHSFLCLTQDINDRTGEVTYKPAYNPDRERRIDCISVLILDESSMLDDKLFEHLEIELRSNSRLRIIFMGDEKQIPPVGKKQETGEANAIPFLETRQKAHKIHVLKLTEPQRQAKGSQIIGYATAIREQHLKQKITYDFPEDKTELELVDRNLEALRAIFKQYFCTDEFAMDADYIKVVAWRNDTVDYFNREIRLLINNIDVLPKIIEHECLIMDAPLIEGKNIIFPNNEEVITTDLSITTLDLKYKVFNSNLNRNLNDEDFTDKIFNCKVYHATLTDLTGKKTKTYILHEDSEKSYVAFREFLLQSCQRCPDAFAKKTLWRQYYKLHETLAWVKYNYCVTGHKSQGSSYDYCVSMEWDIEQNRDIEERNRIRYVAATRARNKLFIVR